MTKVAKTCNEGKKGVQAQNFFMGETFFKTKNLLSKQEIIFLQKEVNPTKFLLDPQLTNWLVFLSNPKVGDCFHLLNAHPAGY
jgi:hypothetical protein